VYKLYCVKYSPGSKTNYLKFAGRIIIADGVLEHLEDHFGMLDRLVPEGPLKTQEAVLRRLERSPYWKVERELPAEQHDNPDPNTDIHPVV
jgi:hypothetical protein